MPGETISLLVNFKDDKAFIVAEVQKERLSDIKGMLKSDFKVVDVDKGRYLECKNDLNKLRELIGG